MSQNRAAVRREFVRLIESRPANFSALCAEFGISQTTGYRWLARYQAGGLLGLSDESRRPRTSPQRTANDIERAIMNVRATNPRWGARRIRKWLLANANVQPPSESTVNRIIKRNRSGK